MRLVFFLRGAVGPQAQSIKIFFEQNVICLQVFQSNQVRERGERESESQLEEIDQTENNNFNFWA